MALGDSPLALVKTIFPPRLRTAVRVTEPVLSKSGVMASDKRPRFAYYITDGKWKYGNGPIVSFSSISKNRYIDSFLPNELHNLANHSRIISSAFDKLRCIQSLTDAKLFKDRLHTVSVEHPGIKVYELFSEKKVE